MLILSRWRAFIRARLYVHRLAIIVFDSRNRAQLIIVLVTLSMHWTRVERERMGIIDNVDASIDVEQFVLGRRPSRNARISRYCSLAFRYLHDISISPKHWYSSVCATYFPYFNETWLRQKFISVYICGKAHSNLKYSLLFLSNIFIS